LSTSDAAQDYNDGFGTNSGLDVFMNTPDMNALETISEFIVAIEKRLKEL
jgi:hypothetical protein